MAKTIPLIAIIGAGGFCREHHRVAQLLQDQGELQLAAACDPSPSVLDECSEKFSLRARGVRLFADYLEMLDFAKAANCAFVAVPTPVPLHAAMHEAIIRRGMAVYLEKPPTLDPDEFERMLAVDRLAPFQTEVGFNFIVHPARLALKSRLLAGEFGPLQEVTLLGHWPRPASYYQRAGWAGQLMIGDRLVLDSCLTNALAHFVHDVLFWAGGTPGPLSWAAPAQVTTIMAHGHAIPSSDTVFLEARLTTAPRIRIALSHATSGPSYERETARCRDAAITFKPYGAQSLYEIAWNDGRRETFSDDNDCLKLNYRAYLDYLTGKAARPITRLEDCRPFVQLCTMAFAAATKIHTLPTEPAGETHEHRRIPGLAEQMESFIAGGPFPTQIATIPVTPGTIASPTNLAQILREKFVDAASRRVQ